MSDKQKATAWAAQAVDKVIGQGNKPNPADVLVANVALRAAAKAGATGADINAARKR